MLYKNGYYATAVNLASNLIYNYRYKSLLLNKRFLKILYPMPYLDYVRKYAYHYGIPLNLIYGIMRQESRYNPVCYSSASAIGLMQIIPSTGYYIARRTGCYNFNPSMLYRKNINISFGSYYLKTLLEQFNGRKYLAIASYNAGPGAVAYWRNDLMKNYEMLLFIELIPYGRQGTT
jgi:Soluble lytic murein transglycosylase and related regulatory proteins (some contain LysM/invasin domains)